MIYLHRIKRAASALAGARVRERHERAPAVRGSRKTVVGLDGPQPKSCIEHCVGGVRRYSGICVREDHGARPEMTRHSLHIGHAWTQKQGSVNVFWDLAAYLSVQCYGRSRHPPKEIWTAPKGFGSIRSLQQYLKARTVAPMTLE